ncbi:hypothetical protein [Asaia prunellae]|uniref:hypothetical protein n=1 Tax=Asaia prunellae TaxID=610245 RepID=UPI00046EE006|nr:hypothetical protein [Asaia prunellae]
MAAPLFVLLGMGLILGASALFYLAAHQQQILRQRLAFRPCMIGGFLASILSCLAFSSATSPLVGVFMAFVALMLVLSLSPIAIALVVGKGRP